MIKSQLISNAYFTSKLDLPIPALLKEFNIDVFSEMNQTHSNIVKMIKSTGIYNTDAIITSMKALPLVVKTADCMPILMSDEIKVSAVHSGWKGVKNKIFEKTISKFDLNSLKVSIGPYAKDCCYEVKKDVATNFPGSIKNVDNKLFLNLSKNIEKLAQKLNFELEVSNICTICNSDYNSYRKSKTKDRQYGIIWL